jgi:hypothetical protein
MGTISPGDIVVYTIGGLSLATGIPYHTVKKAAASGQLKTIKLGSRGKQQLAILHTDAESWIAEHWNRKAKL